MPKVRENEIDGKVLESLKRDELMDDLEMPEQESEVEDSNFEMSDRWCCICGDLRPKNINEDQ